MFKKTLITTISIIVFSLILSCGESPKKDQPTTQENVAEKTSVKNVDWAKNMVMYEVNLRCFSEAGTFKEFEKHLPRIKAMGVTTLWFMPIQPIGEEKIKGNLGSPWAIKDYESINPRMGTIEEFKSLVQKIHEMDMYVLMEWVGNHASWDNVLTKSHPDWFDQDENGGFVPPRPDWEDVIEVNYENKELSAYMQNEILRWVKETDIDGFRFDVAGMMPTKFWEDLKPKLDEVKPLFVFTDGNEIELTDNALDMIYNYDFIDIMTNVSQGKSGVSDIKKFLDNENEKYAKDAFKLYFTSGHVPNSFHGSVFERLGDAVPTFAVLNATLDGIPLVYGGQEAGLNKRLSFYDKDEITWKEHEFYGLYQKLFQLRKTNQALWAGESGGKIQMIPTADNDRVMAFYRKKNEDQVICLYNFSDKDQEITVADLDGNYTELFSDQKVTVGKSEAMKLGPWGYQVLVKQP